MLFVPEVVVVALVVVVLVNITGCEKLPASGLMSTCGVKLFLAATMALEGSPYSSIITNVPVIFCLVTECPVELKTWTE